MSNNPDTGISQIFSHFQESQMQSPGTETKAPNIRGMQEYKVAMELEVWKEQQQRLFEAQVWK